MGFGNRGASRYDPPGAASRQDDGRSAAVFALMKSWAAAIVVLVLGGYLQGAVLFDNLAGPERLESFGWRLVLLHLPATLWAGLATLAAARLHREPFRTSSAQHLLAALAVPLASQVANLAYLWGSVVAEGIWMSSLAVLAGCVAGMAADMALDARDT